ncbi:hypothetical protein [Parvularcula sp. LCG005]|uniref:hypothetical protein n=1 Tax=Parvularcula sp. LCG005 TaxID=3078805 RepID=UPI0029434869|nr:hypothetical protein [Parvularcula sp. LCG005]WOI52189.1 hypothetical protein RUI03_08485 [Parvularcula sp. LCG005]
MIEQIIFRRQRAPSVFDVSQHNQISCALRLKKQISKRHIQMNTIKKYMFLIPGCIALSGCAYGVGDRSYGDQLKDQGGETSAIGKDWNDGETAMKRGEELIRSGDRQIREGQEDRRRGEAMVREGEAAKRNAERAMELRELSSGSELVE